MTDRVGQKLGNYALLRLIGRGAFAEVYLGRHVHLETLAAVKVLHTQLSHDDVDTFRNEARTLVHLVHPYIVRVLDYGIDGSTPFLVMDYAPNGTLRQLHPRGTRVPLPTVVYYVMQLASALQYAHNEQLVHRDVKPENMLVSRHNEILLSDFGIAVVAQSINHLGTQEMAGTIGYMAPEQIQARPRPASDQYALGTVVYEWLSGERPFNGSFAEIAVKQALVSPPPLREKVPDIPRAVEEVLHIALEKNPHKRFANVRAFAFALEEASYHPADLPTKTLPAMYEQSSRNDGISLSQPAQPDGFPARPNLPGQTLVAPVSPVAFATAIQPSENISQQTLIAPVSPVAFATAIQAHVTEVAPPLPVTTGRPQRQKSGSVWWPMFGSLITLVIIAGLIAWLAFGQHLPGAFGATSTEGTSYPKIAGSYDGSLHNTRANIYAPMTLAITQKQGSISGEFSVGQPLLGNGQFTGSIDTQKHIRFLVQSADTSAPILFSGAIQPNGGLSGTYCSVNTAHKCDTQAGGRGVWSVIRLSAG